MSTAEARAKWHVSQLGDLCEISIGRTPARARRDYWGPGSPWLSIADMNQGRDLESTAETITDVAVRECNCRLIPAGTVLLSFKLSVGKVGITKRPMFTNEAIAALRIKDASKILPDFLYWSLRSIDLTRGLDRAAKGLTLNSDKLHRVRIALPPLPEQRRIAEILDKTDALRAKRRAALAQLDTLTQSIFLDMFGDPATNPKGWRRASLEELFEVARGGSPRPIDDYITDSENGINWIMIGDAPEGAKYITGTKKRIRPEGAKRSRAVKPGDFLLTNSMSFGRPYIMRTSGCIHDGWLVLSPRGRNASPDYFYSLLGSRALFAEFSRRAPGATVKNLNIDLVRGVVVPVPPVEEQEEYARVISAIERSTAPFTNSLDAFDTLFAALQHRAFRGEL